MRWVRRQLELRSGARFIVAGIANTVFGFFVYGGVILAGGRVWAALLTGVVAGVLFNFVTVGGYAFRQLSPRTFPRFVACYALIYVVNLFSIDLLAGTGLGAVGAQAVLTIPIAALSYLLMRYVAFPPKTTPTGPAQGRP